MQWMRYRRCPEKWVELAARDCGGSGEISLTDSAGDIPSSILDKMGQPFFTSKEVGRGTGLGLSISTGIAEDHRGGLKVDTKCLNTPFVVRLAKIAAAKQEAAGSWNG